jgi:hypothetical protein
MEEMRQLKRDQKKERKRAKERRKLQLQQDKRDQKMAKRALHDEFEERRHIRTKEREFRRLAREFGNAKALEMQREQELEADADDLSDDESVSTMNSEEERARVAEELEQRAQAKARFGQFVGDVKIMACANLPKVRLRLYPTPNEIGPS